MGPFLINARRRGVEPLFSGSKPGVLPLDDLRLIYTKRSEWDLNPRTPQRVNSFQDYRFKPLSHRSMNVLTKNAEFKFVISIIYVFQTCILCHSVTFPSADREIRTLTPFQTSDSKSGASTNSAISAYYSMYVMHMNN